MARGFYLAAAAAVLALFVPRPATPAEAKGRPRVQLRASPKVAFPPADVLIVAELKGGEAVEDYYCPALEWEWGDGSRSVEESDCPPFETGMQLERFYSARHVYRGSGNYDVKVTLRRAERTIAVATIPVRLFGESGAQSQ